MDKPFNGGLLALARQIRRLSQLDLVDRLNGQLSQGNLSKIEHGRIQPSAEIATAFSEILGFRRSFFFESAVIRDPPISYHRKRAKLSAGDRDAIHGVAEVVRLNLRKLLDSVEVDTSLPPIPSIDPDENGRDVEALANILRQRWMIPRGPIADLTTLVEQAGVIIVPLDFGSEMIDGFCQFSCDNLPPLIFLNANQPKDRYRFSLAHEVGHLLMHQTPHPEQEIEANRFASELLMPDRDIANDFEQHSLTRFMELKLYWGVPMQALIYKAWQIGSLNDRMYKYYIIEMSKRGFRKREPVEASHLKERPSTLSSVMDMHLGALEMTLDDIGEMLGLTTEDLERIYPLPRQRPKLRLVKSAYLA
jgi:Zn-dependent peptidase ImmA (M78 family)/transcriptional regulator with XRE-family HTH domain